jgi:hypothetical protein
MDTISNDVEISDKLFLCSSKTFEMVSNTTLNHCMYKSY